MHNPETGVNEETDEANSTVRIVGGNVFVELDPDHPGFQDEGYRERRNEIAKIAIEWNEMSMAERRTQKIPERPIATRNTVYGPPSWSACSRCTRSTLAGST